STKASTGFRTQSLCWTAGTAGRSMRWKAQWFRWRAEKRSFTSGFESDTEAALSARLQTARHAASPQIPPSTRRLRATCVVAGRTAFTIFMRSIYIRLLRTCTASFLSLHLAFVNGYTYSYVIRWEFGVWESTGSLRNRQRRELSSVTCAQLEVAGGVMKVSVRIALFVFLAAVFSVRLSFTQQITGSVTGTVTDASGAAVSG